MKQKSEKLSDFEKFNEEINELYKDLKKKNFSNDEIAEIFKPILETRKSGNLVFFMIFALVFATYALSRVEIFAENLWWYSLAISRIFLIKILPIYDWTHLKNQQCLVPKWWDSTLTKNFTPNCNLCENLKVVDNFNKLTEGKLTELYLDVQKPTILTENIWPAFDEFSTNILQDDFFLSSIPCALETNMLDRAGTVEKILRKSLIFDSFFMHFQNCEYESMKFFRKITEKPDFVPHTVSPVQYNWLLWSKNYTFPIYKKIKLEKSEDVKIIGQISGKFTFKLTPPETCVQICENLDITLKENQFLIFTNFWQLEYRNAEKNRIDNVAAILEAHYII